MESININGTGKALPNRSLVMGTLEKERALEYALMFTTCPGLEEKILSLPVWTVFTFYITNHYEQQKNNTLK